MSSGAAARTAAVEPFLGNLRLSLAHGSELERAILLELRRAAWSAEPAVPPELERSWAVGLDDHDANAIHGCVWDCRRLIATARMTFHERFADVPDRGLYPPELELSGAPIASLNRLVVAPGYRGLGLAHVLDEVRCRWAVGLGAQSIIGAVARGHERRLERLGFTPKAFFEATFVGQTGAPVATPSVLLVR